MAQVEPSRRRLETLEREHDLDFRSGGYFTEWVEHIAQGGGS